MAITQLSKYQIAETKTFLKLKTTIDEKLIIAIVDFKHRQQAYD